MYNRWYRRLAYFANPLERGESEPIFPYFLGLLFPMRQNISLGYGYVLLSWRSQKLRKLGAILLTSHTDNLLALLKNRVCRVGINSHVNRSVSLYGKSQRFSRDFLCWLRPAGQNLFKVRKITLAQHSVNVVLTLFCWLWTGFGRVGGSHLSEQIRPS